MSVELDRAGDVPQDPDQMSMFPTIEPVPDPKAGMSPDQRRTAVQRERIEQGLHPLSGVARCPIPLHPDAPRGKEGTGPRCGTCSFRRLTRHHDKTYAKCGRAKQFETRGASSDVRAWWPACRGYEPQEDQ